MPHQVNVLFLTDYFPRPSNPAMGTWALDQAVGLRDAGMNVRVVSYISWFPKFLTKLTGKGESYSECPAEYEIKNLKVIAPRWYYQPLYRMRVLLQPLIKFEYPLLWKLSGQALLDEIDRFQPDVIYAHHTVPNGYFAFRASQARGIPFVVADFDFNTINGCRKLAKKRALFSEIKNAALLNVAAAQQMADDIAEIFPNCQVEAIHHGLALSTLPETLPEKPDAVLFSACIFYHRKGLADLIAAFEKVAATHSSVTLRLAGDGPEREQIEELVRNSSYQDRITLLGKLSREDVYQEMKGATAFVLLGWNEPFATVYLEAMAHGLPIIACDDGGINDVVTSGENGFFVPPRSPEQAAEAIQRLLDEPELRLKMSETNQELIREKLNLDVFAQRLQHVFSAE